jgi:hypothetical protein
VLYQLSYVGGTTASYRHGDGDRYAPARGAPLDIGGSALETMIVAGAAILAMTFRLLGSEDAR